jgi:F420-0:gamma-glutamyl ligase
MPPLTEPPKRLEIPAITGLPDMVMGKLSCRPAAIIRHFQWRPEPGKASIIIRPREKDLFR